MADVLTDATALLLVGSLRDLRVQLEISNGLAVQQRADVVSLAEELRRVGDRLVCLEEAVSCAAAAWDEVVRRTRDDGSGAGGGV